MSAASRRSSSISSSSSSDNSTTAKSSKGNNNGIKKKFACTHEGCGKSFSRSEHLHRHALNHKDGNNTCQRCSAHFRRRDLLDRHMARHKEKDVEAGGEGLGFLATRKRLWRDSDGNIVNCRRPYSQEHHQAKRRQISGSPEQRRRSSAGSIIEIQKPIAAPLSPPISLPSTASISGSVPYTSNDQVHDGGSRGRILEDGAMFFVDPMLSAASDDFDNFLCNSGWGAQAPVNTFHFGVGGASSHYDEDPLKFESLAMSFNASFNNPFTTPDYYSWLFDKDSDCLETTTNQEPKQLQNRGDSLDARGRSTSFNDENSSYVGTSNTLSAEHLDLLGNGFESPSTDVPAILASMHMTGVNGHFYQPSEGYMSSVLSETQPSSSQRSPFSGERSEYATPKLQMPRLPRNLGQSPNNQPDVPPDAFLSAKNQSFPKIANQARDGLMQLIGNSHPCKPNGSPILMSDPLLSLSSLQDYSDSFFSRFNSSYPLIHKATFEPSNVHPFLLMAILLLGATYSDKEAHLLAVCIHDIMRPLIHSSKDFSANPKLWMLQTILLVECFGKSRAGEKQHDMSHLYHGLLINLIRRSDCQSAYIPAYEEGNDLEDYWHEAVIAEQKRRLAMLCFLWDTQHAVLFSQSLCMNASELKLTLPWDPAIWEASSAQEWHELTTTSITSPPQYLSVLKSYTNPNSSTNPSLNNLNALSRVLILHGLMSLAWDLHRRDQTSLGLSNLKSAQTTSINSQVDTTTWQARIGASYDAWYTDFSTYTTSVLNSLPHSSTRLAKFQKFTVASVAIYHTAQMILNIDIIDLQIYAGAKHILGRGITRMERGRSRRRVMEWFNFGRKGRERSAKAVWHAARLFRDGLMKLESWGVDEMFHYPWCLYLSALMCWVFHEAAVGNPDIYRYDMNIGHTDLSRIAMAKLERNQRTMEVSRFMNENGRSNGTGTGIGDDEDSEWDARAEMSAFISGITRFGNGGLGWEEQIWRAATKVKTGGLLRCMVKQLTTVRWALVREGMIVLRGLVEAH